MAKHKSKHSEDDDLDTVDETVLSIDAVPAGVKRWRIEVPGCHLPAKEVEAPNETSALAVYMAELGIWSLPHQAKVEEVA